MNTSENRDGAPPPASDSECGMDGMDSVPSLSHPPKYTGRELFVKRMKHEGQYRSYSTRLRHALRTATSDPAAVELSIMRRFGYTSDEQEISLYQQRRIARSQGIGKVPPKLATFDAAFATLPDSGDPRTELDWVRAHPAMTRQARGEGKGGTVILVTAEDILCPPHGKAPSKPAVVMLQHFVNNPAEFFKQQMGEQKKALVSKEGKNDKTNTSRSQQELMEILQAHAGTTQNSTP